MAIVEVADPRPGPGDVLVRIEASAICGSERRAFIDGVDGNDGHEACGRIVDAGASGFAVGTRVGLSAIVGCGECDRCLSGRETQCRRGFRMTCSPGWHAELVSVPASAIRELPAGADPLLGVLLSGDTLGVPARGLRRMPSSVGDSVLVIGLGPIGLGHLVVRRFAGANVVAIEPSRYRRDLALNLGAAEALEPGEEVSVRPSVVIECTGRPECITQALEIVDTGGSVLQSGQFHQEVPMDPATNFVNRELTYAGSFYYASEDYPSMLALVEEGLPLQDICTHEVGAQDAQAAVTAFLEGQTGKVVLRWDQ